TVYNIVQKTGFSWLEAFAFSTAQPCDTPQEDPGTVSGHLSVVIMMRWKLSLAVGDWA
ncbi:hypothetical protein HispidOSU_026289, partial [Sigmodon hispidus]